MQKDNRIAVGQNNDEQNNDESPHYESGFWNFVNDHPFITLFIAFELISGIKYIARSYGHDCGNCGEIKRDIRVIKEAIYVIKDVAFETKKNSMSIATIE